jgi:hypothetical protein
MRFIAVAGFVHEALTVIVKDIAASAENQRRFSGAGQSRHAFQFAASIARPRSGNGDQAWL